MQGKSDLGFPPPGGVCSRANWRALSSYARSLGCRNVLREPVVKPVVNRESELPLRGGCHGLDGVDGHSLGVLLGFCRS